MLSRSSAPLFRTLWGTFWILLSALLVSAALALVLLRTALPTLGLFQEDLESWLEGEVGVPVELGAVTLSLQGRSLQLTASDLSFMDPNLGVARASLQRGEIEVDLLQSLRHGTIVTTAFSVYRPELSVLHRSDGSLMVEGFGDEAGVAAQVIGWLLSQPVVHIEGAVLNLREERLQNLQWNFSGASLSLINSGYRHQATGQVIIGGKDGKPVSIELEWFGDLMNSQGWDGQMHLSGEAVQLVSLAGGEQAPWRPLAQGEAEVEFWGEWLSGRLEKGRGVVARSERWRDAPGLAGGQFLWKRKSGEQWRLQLEQLLWGGEKIEERSSHPSSALVERRLDPATGEDLLVGGVDQVRLVSSPELSGLYATLARGGSGILVSGELRQLQFRSRPTSESLLSRIEAAMELHQISVQGIQNLEGIGIHSLNGQLRVGEQGGELIPEAGVVKIDSGNLYPHPLSIDLHQSPLKWRNHPAGLYLLADPFQVTMGALQMKGGTELLMPSGGGAPQINLKSYLAAEKIPQLIRQLPVSQMSPRLVEWLEQSFLKGRISLGQVVIQGALDQFPFSEGEGRFEADLMIDGLDLRYAESWPTLMEGAGRLRFQKERMQFDLERGQLDGHAVHDLVIVSDPVEQGPVRVHGQVVSESSQLMQTLLGTPLQKQIEGVERELDIEGYAFLDLKVSVPLALDQQTSVDGRVEFHDNRLQVHDLGVVVEDLHGNLEFNQESITIDGVSAKALGGPLHLNAFTAGAEGERELLINAKGEIDHNALDQWLEKRGVSGLPLKVHAVDGEDLAQLSWDGRLRMDLSESERAPVEVHLHSDLQGVEVELPSPFHKLAESRWPTTLTLHLQQGALQQFELSSPDRIKSVLNRGADGQWLGTVRLGQVKGQVDEEADAPKGIRVDAGLKSVDLEGWLNLYREMPERESPLPTFELEAVTLSAEDAPIFGHQLQDLSLRVEPHQDGFWGVEVDSVQLKGQAEIPLDAEQQMVINLERVDLQSSAEEDSEGKSIEVDPSQIPPMVVTSQQTRINGIDFGALELKTHRTSNGLFFDDVTLESDVLQLNAQGGWLKRDNASLSRFNIHARGDELGKILALFDYDGEIDQGATSAQIKAEWEGSPVEFSLGVLEGNMELSVEKGHLRDVDQGVGRVFGLLGIHTLARRLSLDFSDITDKGFPFDTIEGSFLLKNGHAHTRDLVVDGPAATIKMVGRTGIVAQDYDQIVSMSPKISETLPATGALVGGPAGAAVGSVVLLYQKLFKKEGIATTRYTLTGSWADPKLEKIEKRRGKPPVTELIAE